ncbi:PREDICTED: uncharacterized protein LOC104802488 [Tarenaya hassleriana]|uniref:uncharacterized protein LOC104802488 n=1 Tax=Tarenaya hassleriana TaxID=28532 RepID=UPI00053C124B|nr:PREDICTED: uncharacterized protein LOC104802488 [Tarenaya hassleriana]
MEPAKANANGYQRVIVMRHGDQIDNFEPLWVSTAARPWDPPLVQDGLIRAFRTGQRIRSQTGFPVHRVFVSPFLRCIQTASEVVAALSAVDVDPNAMSSKDVDSIDQSKLKVAIELGLCEMLNSVAIRRELAPKDGNFGFNNISDLEAMFPDGMVDRNTDRVYKELPKWEETVEGCRDRYVNMVKALADNYPSENLLLVTHGEGVGTVLSTFLEDVTVYEVDYCAYVELRRRVSNGDGSLDSGKFEVITSHGQAGIQYHPSSTTDLHDHIISQTPV